MGKNSNKQQSDDDIQKILQSIMQIDEEEEESQIVTLQPALPDISLDINPYDFNDNFFNSIPQTSVSPSISQDNTVPVLHTLAHPRKRPHYEIIDADEDNTYSSAEEINHRFIYSFEIQPHIPYQESSQSTIIHASSDTYIALPYKQVPFDAILYQQEGRIYWIKSKDIKNSQQVYKKNVVDSSQLFYYDTDKPICRDECYPESIICDFQNAEIKYFLREPGMRDVELVTAAKRYLLKNKGYYIAPNDNTQKILQTDIQKKDFVYSFEIISKISYISSLPSERILVGKGKGSDHHAYTAVFPEYFKLISPGSVLHKQQTRLYWVEGCRKNPPQVYNRDTINDSKLFYRETNEPILRSKCRPTDIICSIVNREKKYFLRQRDGTQGAELVTASKRRVIGYTTGSHSMSFHYKRRQPTDTQVPLLKVTLCSTADILSRMSRDSENKDQLSIMPHSVINTITPPILAIRNDSSDPMLYSSDVSDATKPNTTTHAKHHF